MQVSSSTSVNAGLRRTRWVAAARLGWRVGTVLFWALPVAGAVPTIDYLYPAGGPQGANFPVVAGGDLKPWPVHVWTDDAGVVLKPGGTSGQFQAEIDGSARPGPHLVRFYNAQGASTLRCFLVGQLSEQTLDPASGIGESRLVLDQLPITLNGRLRQRGATGRFSVALAKLDSAVNLRAQVDAYSLDSPLDLMLTLYNAAGTPLTVVHEAQRLDPRLSWPINKPGTYVLQVACDPKADAKFAGSDAGVYRLTVGTEPLPPPPPQGQTTNYVQEGVQRAYLVAQQVAFPSTIRGTLGAPNHQDRYRLDAQGNDQFYIRVKAGSLGSPFKPIMTILDEGGNPLLRSSPAPDPELTWVAPTAGTYILVLEDADHNGGWDYAYELELGLPVPHFAARIIDAPLRLTPGGRAELRVTTSRPGGYEAPVSLLVTGLPPGVSFTPVPVPPSGGPVSVTLMAAGDVAPTNCPFKVFILALDPAAPQTVPARVLVEGRYAVAGGLATNQTDQAWLTVLPKPASASP